MTSQPIDAPVRVVRRRSVEWLPYLLSLPALLVCVGILIPFVTALYYSTLRFRLNLPALKGFIWFGNYTNLLYDAEFWNTVSISLRYTAITVGVELVLGLIIALLLQRQTRLNNLISVLLLLPLMTAPAIAALMWKLMTNPNFGILSYLVSLAGISDFRWASSPSSALFTVVLVDVWVYTPFMMVLLLAGLRSLPQQPFEAAALDDRLSRKMQVVREVVSLGLRARMDSKLRVRQPLRTATIVLNDDRDAELVAGAFEMVAEELNVVAVKLATREDRRRFGTTTYKPNFRTLGQRGLGKVAQELKGALAREDAEAAAPKCLSRARLGAFEKRPPAPVTTGTRSWT